MEHPINRRVVPDTSGHFILRVAEMANPAEAPPAAEITVGTMRYRPDVVAEVRSTAWKYKGLATRG